MLKTQCQPYIADAIAKVCRAVNHTSQPGYLHPRKLAESSLLRELAACILGSRVRFETAYRALEHLSSQGLLRTPERYMDQHRNQKRLEDAMRHPCVRYPFPRQRATQLSKALAAVYREGGSLRQMVRKNWDVHTFRSNLVRRIPGLGPKQASLFLTRIGYSDDLAVLDRHILSYMEWMGMIDAPAPWPGTVNKYEDLENQLRQHARVFGVPLSACDLAIWVVVRLVKKEFRTWVS